MQNNLATPPPQWDKLPGTAGRAAFLPRLIGRHPYLGALFLLVYWLALLIALGRLLVLVLWLIHLHIPPLLANLIGEVLIAFVVILPLALFGWWSEAGFTRGTNARGIVICLIPFLLIAGPALLGLPVIVGEAPASIIVIAVVLSLLVGFVEEGMFRGLILRSLLPKGIWPAVLLSAFCFACVHLTNLISGASWGYVAEQMILAFGTGVLFAAIRLRTGSIWPSIFLHAFRDVAGLILLGINPSILKAPLSNAATAVNGTFCLIFLLNALVLLRGSQVRKLEVAYGLVPAPAPIPPGSGPMSLPYTPPPVSYRDYTSPEAYRDQQPPETPFNDGEGRK